MTKNKEYVKNNTLALPQPEDMACALSPNLMIKSLDSKGNPRIKITRLLKITYLAAGTKPETNGYGGQKFFCSLCISTSKFNKNI